MNKRQIKFRKMHGAGNDFILVDNRDAIFPHTDIEWIAAICNRRTGIGSDGLILIENSEIASFFMRFYNPDGREADMCGNGARCVARFAYDLGIALENTEFETRAGKVSAIITDQDVTIGMPDPKNIRRGLDIEALGQVWKINKINTGVPHAVIKVNDVNGIDLQGIGAAIRYHEAFMPDGTNVNFIQVLDAHTLKIRTYERGVEAETLACGTGAVASALTTALDEFACDPVTIISAGNVQMSVGFAKQSDSFRKVTLTGPAVHVFEGVVEYLY
ncbi:MAG: diaminopimelate epimerase [Lentisphaerae bacterium]|nr:diaminopimelate epimerase [Lentisphaerota bacterium]